MTEAALTAERIMVPEPVVGHRYVLPFAPPMPPEFWGEVTYRFQGGKLVQAVVEEMLKP